MFFICFILGVGCGWILGFNNGANWKEKEIVNRPRPPYTFKQTDDGRPRVACKPEPNEPHSPYYLALGEECNCPEGWHDPVLTVRVESKPMRGCGPG